MTHLSPTRAAAMTLLLFVQPGGPPSGDAVIRAPAGQSEIVITTSSRFAGAIQSLTWNGREFIDCEDHGRELQSASFIFDRKPFTPGVFNPTEAGSARDALGPTSSSRLLEISAQGADLRTLTQMAFWLAPGMEINGEKARNTTVLSNHLLEKRVHIGYKNLPHAISYDVTFILPEGERPIYAVFEALTGYMPAGFSKFLSYSSETGNWKALPEGGGEQTDPVILATPDGSHAMGIYSPQQPSPQFPGTGYGRASFPPKVNKWNCVFRIQDPKGIKPGKYSYRMYVAVGTLFDVVKTIGALQKESHP